MWFVLFCKSSNSKGVNHKCSRSLSVSACCGFGLVSVRWVLVVGLRGSGHTKISIKVQSTYSFINQTDIYLTEDQKSDKLYF